MTESLPAIPVNKLTGVDDVYPSAGRVKLREVVARRLAQQGTDCNGLFADGGLLEDMITFSGGHISDLILLVRQAVLEAQTDDASRVSSDHVRLSIRARAQEYTRLIENKYLPILAEIQETNKPHTACDEYRELMFKRLALEYWIDNESVLDLHPLVAGSNAYTKWINPSTR
jgi:hypothetical protein